MTRLYSIEFLRIIFTFLVILGHCLQRYPEFKENVKAFFNSSKVLFSHTHVCVEYFFIIAGFFLYKSIQNNTKTVFSSIQKIYIRVAPAFIFLFILCVIFKINKFYNLSSVIILNAGLSLPKEITGWGDWYVGVYFWTAIFYIAIFRYFPQKAIFITLVLIYFTTCLRFNAKYSGWITTYYTIIGSELIRGVYSIGVGLVFGFLAQKIHIIKNRLTIILCSITEIACLYSVILHVTRGSSLTFLELEVIFGILLVSLSKSLGILSQYLNKMSWINLFSKYSYQVFLMHIFPLKLLMKHESFGFSVATCVSTIFLGAIFLGVAEYHLIDNRLLPFIRKTLSEEKTR